MKNFPSPRTLLPFLVGLLPVVAPASVKDAPYRWKSVAVVAGGFISGIDFSPIERGLAYVRTDIGGAYRWDAKGEKWVPLQDWLTKQDWNLYGVESIGVDPVDSKRVYLACGTYTNEWGGNGAILRSDDQGRTFERTDLPFKNGGNEDGRSMGERLAVDPNDHRILFFGTRLNGLWRSEDFGKTWLRIDGFPMEGVESGLGLGIVVFDPRSGSKGKASQTIYVGAASNRDGLLRSLDGGKSWSATPGQPTHMFPHHAFLAKNGVLYVTYTHGPGPNGVDDGAVWKLDTNTGNWTDISPVKPHHGKEGGFGYAGLTVDPNHPETVMVSTMDRWNPGDDVFCSHDGGQSWVGLREHSHRNSSISPYVTWNQPQASFGWWIGALALDPFHPSTVLYGTGATIWGTDDADAAETQWRVWAQGIEETADIDLLSPMVGPHLISGLGDIGGFTHRDLDQTPADGMTVHPMSNNTDCLAEAGSTPGFVVRVGRGSEQPQGGYSIDGGLTWKQFPSAPAGRRQSGSIAVSADGKAIVWAPEGSAPYWTTDFGVTWTEGEGAPKGVQLVADPLIAGRIYALAGDGSLYVSEDGGKAFKAGASHLPKHERMRAVIGQTKDLWLPCESGLLRSTDGGLSFSAVTGVDSAESVGFGRAAPGSSYPAIYLNGRVQGQDGVFRSDDLGSNWVRISDAKHEYGTRGVVTGDPRIYGRVYMGTNGRGVFYADPIGR
jgi:photosystem II stability/assembly factor-like uncharacterized protein